MNYFVAAFLVLFFCVSNGFSNPASGTPPDTSTVALWHFDEGAGDTLRDETNFHHNGVIHSASWVQGKFGTALHFDGLTSYVILPTTPDLKPTQAFTLEAWISPDTLYFPPPAFNVYHPVILSTLGLYPYGGGYQLDMTNLGLRFDVRTGASDVSIFSQFTPLPAAHVFYHVAATYERVEDAPTPYTIMKTYLNGVLTDSSVYAESIQYYQTPYLYLGTNVDGGALGTIYHREFPGIIDEVRISRIAKTAAQLNVTRLLVSAHDLDFGLVELGQTPQKAFEISNASFTSTLHVDSITGTNPAFSFDHSGFDLAPLESHQLPVTYAPTGSPADTGLLTIYANNAEESAVTVVLLGRGFTLTEAPIIKAISDIPRDQGHQVRVQWFRSIYDSPAASPRASEYGIWRRVEDPPPGAAAVSAGAASDAVKGERHTVAIGGELWDFIATIPAVQFDEYALVAPTLYDATHLAPYWSVFRASAHTVDGQFFFSNPDSGFSTDDLAPPPPASLQVSVASGSVNLSWPEVEQPDLKEYVIYRSTSPIVVRSPEERVATSQTTSFRDNVVTEYQTYYYAVTSVDRSDNESQLAATGTAVFAVGAGEDGLFPHEYGLAQNYPNPFNPATSIRYALPARSHVRLSIYNPLGQTVGSIVDEVQDAGYYAKTWSADVASGIYFYKLEATSVEAPGNAFVSIRKMLLVR